MARSREVGAPFVAIALGSLSFYLLLVVRLFAADGSELSGRIYTYALIPVGLVAAIALDSIVRSFYMRITRLSPLRTYLYGITIGITTTTILMVGGIAAGEPSYYACLPGPYIVDAGERSVDDYNNQAALWMAKHLPHGLGIASDAATAVIVGNVGGETLVNAQILFLNDHWNASDSKIAAADGVSYIVIDLRVTKQLPADGSYFSQDVNAGDYVTPLPLADTTKFDTIPGVSRIYDNGNILIYQLPAK